MREITNSFIGNFGALNATCSEHKVIWQIIKYPLEWEYTGLITPLTGDVGASTVKAELCDDLFEKMIELAGSY